jgi:hypothetical protein
MEDEYVVPALAVAAASVRHKNAIEQRKPKEAVLAMELLAEGKTHDEIAKITGLGFTAIASLRARHDTAIEDRRKQLSADGFEMAEGLRLLTKKKMAQLADDPEALAKTNIRDLVLPYAIAQDKAFSALGEVSRVVVEHKGKGPTLEEAMAAIAEAKAKVKAASIDVLAKDVTPEAV